MTTSVDAVIVHWFGGRQLVRCVRSCLASGAFASVIVVDNGGLDSRGEVAGPGVRIIPMASNVGYGRAANAGLAACTADAALVLNQDVEVSADGVALLLAAAIEAGAWVAGPCLVDDAGRAAEPKDRFPAPLSWPAPPGARGAAGARPVPWVAGAAMLFGPGHLDLRFDPRLFMYVEDEELCWRVWAAGGSVVWVPGATFAHHGGTASGRRWSLPAITRRTVVNRARMVRWHSGRRGLVPFAADVLRRRLRRR